MEPEDPGGGIIREGEFLVIFHPPHATFVCPERGCEASFRAAAWTSARTSVERHLKAFHDIVPAGSINRCRFCDQALGIRPSLHKCTVARPANPPPLTLRRAAFPCKTCDASFTSARGLLNHARSHERSERRAALTTPLPAPDTHARARVASQQATVDDEEEEDPVEEDAPPAPVIGPPTPVPAPQKPTVTRETAANREFIATREFTATRDITATRDTTATPDITATPGITATPEVTTTREPTATPITPPPTITIPPTRDIPVEEEDDPEESPTEDDKLASFRDKFQQLYRRERSNATWLEFVDTLDSMVLHIQQMCKIRTTVRASKTAREIDATDARTIQRLYRRNRRQAVRAILEEKRQRCDIDPATIESHFARVLAKRNFTKNAYRPVADRPTVDTSDFSADEVLKKLKRCENTAPGEDRITYQHLRYVDSDAKTFSVIFNICKKYRQIPPSWKQTRTILIHKKGEANDISNWRPIALCCTLYKLYTGCWATRLTAWMQANEVLHPAQKGFMPFDGTTEHNYVLRNIISEARRGERELCVAWLDLSNAFGSVPHDAVIEAAGAAGVGEIFQDIVADSLANSTTSVLTNSGPTPNIPVEAGVKQGCPLSGLLFNLAIDPVLHELQGGDSQHHRVLAYADDLTLIASNAEDLGAMLLTAQSFIHRLCMRFNAAKSKTLHIKRIQNSIQVIRSDFSLAGQIIPAVRDNYDTENFLGNPVGFSPISSNAELLEIVNVGKKLLSSKLAPWQQLDALKTFVVGPSIHHMRTGKFSKAQWKEVDNIFRAEIKKILCVPDEAANDYIYGPRDAGLCGMPELSASSDFALMDTAFKLLTSRDPRITTMASSELDSTVQRRSHAEPTDELRSRYLSGDLTAPFDRRSTQAADTWTRSRAATTRNGHTWAFEGTSIQLQVSDAKISAAGRHTIMATLRRHHQRKHLQRLLQLQSQGKAIECIATSHINSHFIRDGAYTRFADWRFVHRARLSLVPLNAYRRRHNESSIDARCRRCPYPQETLPHVLNHCMRNAHAYQLRHNAIVARIRNAAVNRGYKIVSENAAIAESNLRPDLVLCKNKKAVIIDVTVVFENRLEAFTSARSEKIAKYTQIADRLKSEFVDVSIEPIVVGSLGSWHKANDKFIHKICAKSYARKMKMLIVSDTIRWSRDVYIEHISGHRQYDVASATQSDEESQRTAPDVSQPTADDDDAPSSRTSESTTEPDLPPLSATLPSPLRNASASEGARSVPSRPSVVCVSSDSDSDSDSEDEDDSVFLAQLHLPRTPNGRHILLTDSAVFIHNPMDVSLPPTPVLMNTTHEKRLYER